MSTFQKIVIVGNAGMDPDTKTFENGGQITNLSIATTEKWKDKTTGEKKELTEWHRVVFQNKLSEIVAQYVKKGDKILVEGKLRTRKWTDGNGVERYSTEIIAREMTMLGSPSGTNNGSAVDQYSPATGSKSNYEDEDDLPF